MKPAPTARKATIHPTIVKDGRFIFAAPFKDLAAGTLITIIILFTKVTRKAVAFDVRLGKDVNDTLFPSFLVFFCYFAVPVE
ncbi:unnamed protein product [Alternaria alternata]